MQYKVLIVGCGNIAGRFDMWRSKDAWPLSHAGAFRRHGGFNLLACVDPDEKVLESFADYWQITRQAKSIEALGSLEREFDVVSICSPTSLHHKHLEEILRLKPRLIFCEKPVAMTLELTAKWSRLCDEQSVSLVVNYTRQWDPSVARITQDISSGAWGKVRSVACYYNKGVLNNGSHMIDLLFRLLGPLKVVAVMQPVFDHWDYDPTVPGLLVSLEAGIPISLNPAHAEDYAFFEMELICERGVIRMRNSGLDWTFAATEPSEHFKGYRVLTNPMVSEGEYLKAMAFAVEEIYSFLQGGNSVRSDGSNAVAVHMICDEILRRSKISQQL